MATNKKANSEAGQPLQSIPLDNTDRKVIMPLIQKVKAGREAEQTLRDYIGAISRRSGMQSSHRFTIPKDYSRLIVLPEDK